MLGELRIAVLLTGIVVAAAAQAGYFSSAQVDINGGPSCVSASPPSPASCSIVGPIGSAFAVNGSGSAYGDADGLHAFAQLFAIATDNLGDGDRIIGSARGGVQLMDFLTFGPTAPASGKVVMTITTHGTTTGGDSYGYTQLDLKSQSSSVVECSFFNAGSCQVTLMLNFEDGLGIDALLSAIAVAHLTGGPGSTGLGTADFDNTAFISSLDFFDSLGDPLNLSYVSSSGLTYPMGRTVHEPSTILLVLMMVPLMLRRRFARGCA